MPIKRLHENVPDDLAAYYDEFWQRGGESIVASWFSVPEHKLRFDTVLDLVRTYAHAVDARTCFEVGAGIGTMTVELSPLFQTVYAADVSGYALEQIPDTVTNVVTVRMAWREPWQTLRRTPNVDVAVCSEVLEHMLKPQRFLRQMLKKCKVAIISMPITEDVNLDTFDLDRLGQEEKPGDAVGHIWTMDWDGFQQFIADYDVIESERLPLNGVAVLRGDLWEDNGGGE